MTRNYDFMLVFRPDLEVTDKTAPAMVKKLVGDAIKVDSVTVTGKKTLAYPIKKQTEGIYVFCTLSGLIVVHDIEKKAQLAGEVLRFLLTVKK